MRAFWRVLRLWDSFRNNRLANDRFRVGSRDGDTGLSRSSESPAETWRRWKGDRSKVVAREPVSGLDPRDIGRLACDIWRIERRAEKTGADAGVLTACELARYTLEELGFEIRDLTGMPYSERLVVDVAEKRGGEGELFIVQCLSPAVFFNHVQIFPARVIIATKEVKDGNG